MHAHMSSISQHINSKQTYFKKKITNVNEITYEFLKGKDDFFDVLATFFATIARVRCNEAKPFLSMNSEDGFFSAFKMFCIEKFEKQKAEELPCFAERKWKRLRESLISIKTDQARKNGHKLGKFQFIYVKCKHFKVLLTNCIILF